MPTVLSPEEVKAETENKIYRAYLAAVAYREKPTAAAPQTDGSLEEILAIAIALTQSCGMLCTKQNLLVRVDGFLNEKKPAPASPPQSATVAAAGDINALFPNGVATPLQPHASHTLNTTDPPETEMRCTTCGATGDALIILACPRDRE